MSNFGNNVQHSRKIKLLVHNLVRGNVNTCAERRVSLVYRTSGRSTLILVVCAATSTPIIYQTHRADCYASTKKSISVPMIHLPWVPGLNYYERWMQTIAGVLLPTRIISRTLVRSLEDSPNTH